LRRVGESDPKGVGVRIIRDDKRVERAAGKPMLVDAAESWNRRLTGRERG